MVQCIKGTMLSLFKGNKPKKDIGKTELLSGQYMDCVDRAAAGVLCPAQTSTPEAHETSSKSSLFIHVDLTIAKSDGKNTSRPILPLTMWGIMPSNSPGPQKGRARPAKRNLTGDWPGQAAPDVDTL